MDDLNTYPQDCAGRRLVGRRGWKLWSLVKPKVGVPAEKLVHGVRLAVRQRKELLERQCTLHEANQDDKRPQPRCASGTGHEAADVPIGHEAADVSQVQEL